jgi:hypothetical protein
MDLRSNERTGEKLPGLIAGIVAWAGDELE